MEDIKIEEIQKMSDGPTLILIIFLIIIVSITLAIDGGCNDEKIE
jgi:hypothetical protein